MHVQVCLHHCSKKQESFLQFSESEHLIICFWSSYVPLAYYMPKQSARCVGNKKGSIDSVFCNCTIQSKELLSIKHQANYLFKFITRASAGSSKNSTLVDPCAPRGYSHNGQVMVRTSGASRSTLENQYVDSGNGNFTECRSTSLLLLQKGKARHIFETANSLFSSSRRMT